MKPQHLTLEDVRGGTWRRLTQDLELKLQDLRESNDLQHDPNKTAEIRGQISFVKEMLALGKELSASTDGHPVQTAWPAAE